ncbi:MAG: hypothetical protein KDC26_06495 [Armatimonadetes bacterium]|nr:hypothetical protein [Armatimonadota bacterium]
MSKAGRAVAMVFVKWFFIPVGMGALGYFIIGPRIGSVPVLESSAEKLQKAVQDVAISTPVAEKPAGEAGEVSGEGDGKFGGVKINVDVKESDGKSKTRGSDGWD